MTDQDLTQQFRELGIEITVYLYIHSFSHLVQAAKEAVANNTRTVELEDVELFFSLSRDGIRHSFDQLARKVGTKTTVTDEQRAAREFFNQFVPPAFREIEFTSATLHLAEPLVLELAHTLCQMHEREYDHPVPIMIKDSAILIKDGRLIVGSAKPFIPEMGGAQGELFGHRPPQKALHPVSRMKDLQIRPDFD